ncbi:MAG TPA: HAD-IB family hydrolase [Candidatus Saccharimonadales bacterium]|nr:HAD-IB family hydrolase [Candidatus Saccharimonadales bacterium]
MVTQKPFAVFDIDGTVIRWQLYHAVADALARTGLIEPAVFDKVRDARMVWKNRASQHSFVDYEQALVAAYDEAIVNISQQQLRQAVEKVFNEYKDQTYTFTRDLIHQLKKQGYLLFAISASQANIIELLARYYEFDDFGGSVYEVVDGAFTGERTPLRRDRKPEYLQQLVTKHDATFKGSIGVGDSDSDIPMLEIVENPIAFNPNTVLFAHAKARGWKVVLERKNMVYELEQHSGIYRLTD